MSELYHNQEDITSKICTACDAEKSLEDFYKRPRGKHKRSSQCIECENDAQKRRQQAYKDNPHCIASEKTCPKCEQKYPISQFGIDTNRKDQHSPFCLECYKKIRSEYRSENQENLKAYEDSRKGDPIRRAKDNLYHRKKSEDPQYKIKHRVYTNRYKETHNAKIREDRIRRREQKKHGNAIEKVDYDRILEQNNGFCYICEGPILPEHKIEFDHIVPISRGGLHTKNNIAVTHSVCNQRKNGRLLEELDAFRRRGIL